MDLFSIIDASWRTYPATLLALSGLVLLAKGLWFGFALAGSEELLETSVIIEALKRAPTPRSYGVRRVAAQGID